MILFGTPLREINRRNPPRHVFTPRSVVSARCNTRVVAQVNNKTYPFMVVAFFVVDFFK